MKSTTPEPVEAVKPTQKMPETNSQMSSPQPVHIQDVQTQSAPIPCCRDHAHMYPNRSPPVQSFYVQAFPRTVQYYPPYSSGLNANVQIPVASTEEERNSDWIGFSEKEIRKKFVRKVYFILAVQLTVTLGMILLFILEPNVKDFVREHRYIHWIAFGVFFGIYIGMVCSGELRRKYPMNIVMLSVFTLATGLMMATLSSYFKTETVAMAVGICAIVCVVVSILSFCAPFDITSCGGILFVLALVLFIYGIAAIFIRSKVMKIVYAALGAIVFTLFLAYDTQLLMGGKTVQISPDEYILAAIQLYIDIVYIFSYILLLSGLNE